MTDQAITILLFLAGIFVTVTLAMLGLIVTSWRAMSLRLTLIEAQLLAMDIRVTPMWAKVQRQISGDLHHPHPRFKEMDSLLEKLDNNTIDDYPGDRDRLLELLEERSHDMDPAITESQRASAMIMATVMEKVVAETAAAGELVNIEATGEKPEGEPGNAEP